MSLSQKLGTLHAQNPMKDATQPPNNNIFTSDFHSFHFTDSTPIFILFGHFWGPVNDVTLMRG